MILGIHSRIDKVIYTVIKNTNVGNTYINRNIAGAVVGSLIIGLTQGYIAYYQLPLESIVGFTLGSGFSLIAPYLVMFIILLIKPDGLFGTKEVERV